MKRFTLLISTITVGLTALLLSMGGQASAQNNDVGQALEIAPPLLNLSLDPGQTITTKIKLRNISGGDLLVTGQINDFVAAGEDGTPKILMDEDDQEEPNPYSIKSWVSTLPQLTLESKQIEDMPVTISVPSNASPGGYYGVVRFTAVPPELEGTGVSLSASLGALMLIRINGDAKESLEIEEFAIAKDGQSGTFFESTPLTFIERLKNTGNIHLQPAGQVIISDMFGKKIASININLPPRNVLPASIRKFEQTLDKSQLGNKWLFGRYTAELTATYGEGDNKQEIKSKVVFWVIPWRLIGVALLALVAGFFVLRTMIRRYNRRIIQKAQGGGSRKRGKRK